MEEGFGLLMVLLYFALIILIIAAYWKIYVKAGKPGWAVLIPIYSFLVLLEIIGKPWWWLLLLLLPLVNIVILFLIVIKLAHSFGKSTGFGMGLLFLGIIFFPILGFGDAEYIGPQD